MSSFRRGAAGRVCDFVSAVLADRAENDPTDWSRQGWDRARNYGLLVPALSAARRTESLELHQALGAALVLDLPIFVHTDVAGLILGASAGDGVVAVAITDETTGSGLAGASTQIEVDADGWAMSGSKSYVSCADAASSFLVLATDKASAEPILVHVDADAEGVSTVPVGNGNAMRGLGVCRVVFESTHLGNDQIIAKGQGATITLLRALSVERFMLSVTAHAAAQEVLARLSRWAEFRLVEGAPLANKQAVGHDIAHLKSELLLVKAFLDSLGSRYERGKAIPLDHAATAKYRAVAALTAVTRKSIGLHGWRPYGHEDFEYLIEAHQNSLALSVAGGPDEVMLEIVSAAARSGARRNV